MSTRFLSSVPRSLLIKSCDEGEYIISGPKIIAAINLLLNVLSYIYNFPKKIVMS